MLTDTWQMVAKRAEQDRPIQLLYLLAEFFVQATGVANSLGIVDDSLAVAVSQSEVLGKLRSGFGVDLNFGIAVRRIGPMILHRQGVDQL